MIMDFVDLHSQQKLLKTNIDKRIKKVLSHGKYILGPEVQELEENLANFIGAKHCITCANGTDALLIALIALGVKEGDEVITPSFSYIAAAEMISLLKARPVFVDVSLKTFNLKKSDLSQAITSKTKAIIPVSLFGQCPDMDEINKIASNFSIPVVEDAAQSFGAKYKNKFSCNLSLISCTSFFPSKPLGCYGDGGALFTNNEDLAIKIKQICRHGQKERYHHIRLGMNSRLDTLQAAILLAKLEIYPNEVISRNKIAQNYDGLFTEIGFSSIPYIESYNKSVYAQYTIKVPQRVEIQNILKENNIPTAVYYPLPIHKQPVFLSKSKESLKNAEQLSKEVISLPMHPYLKMEDQEKIVQLFEDII